MSIPRLNPTRSLGQERERLREREIERDGERDRLRQERDGTQQTEHMKKTKHDGSPLSIRSAGVL